MVFGFSTKDDVYDDAVMLMMLYTTDLVTQQHGVVESNIQVDFIHNITSMPRIMLDLALYQTTDDIWGFSLAGARDPKDFDSSFILNTNIR